VKSGDLAYRDLLVHLKRVRRGAGMHQSELAYAMDRDQPFVSRVERGQTELGLVDFVLWAKALRLDPAEELRRFAEGIQPRRRRTRL
jgi:transcriptional regulator with XRE-family HTH domain